MKWVVTLIGVLVLVVLLAPRSKGDIPKGRSSTVTFATYDAADIEKYEADVVLNGVNDGTVINAKLLEYTLVQAVKFQFLGHYIRPDVPIVINRGGVTYEGYNAGGRDPTPETGTIFWPQGSFAAITVQAPPVPGSMSNVLLSRFGTKAGTYGVLFSGGVVDSYVEMLKIEDPYTASIKLENNGAAPGWIYIDLSNLTSGNEGALVIDSGVSEVQLNQSGLYSSAGPAILNRGGTLLASNIFAEFVRNHIVKHEAGTTLIDGAVLDIGDGVNPNIYDGVNINGSGIVKLNAIIVSGRDKMRWGVNVEGGTAKVSTANMTYINYLTGKENIPPENRD